VIAERLRRLGDLMIALARSPVPTHLFEILAAEAGKVVPADALVVCLRDPDDLGYATHALASAGSSPLTPWVLGLDEGLAGPVIRTGRPCVVDDLAAGPARMSGLEMACHQSGLRAAAVVPLRRGLDVLGALFFAARPPVVYSDEDVQLATLMAAAVSATLENARAYQALADERGTLAALLGSTQDAVLVVNSEGLVLLANPAVQGMLGLAHEAITGHTLESVPLDPRLCEWLRAGGPSTAELPLPDGRTAQVSVVAVTTAYGETVGVAAILRDISLLKQLAQMKNDFVSTVSHDLKNPLSVILGTAELMVRQGPADPRFPERCERIRRTASYMNELVSDLLDLGRIEAGLDVPAERVDLRVLVPEVIAALQSQADQKQIGVATDLGGAVPVLAAGPRLTQALLNLVGNAIKYTRPGGRVAVSVRPDAEPGARGVVVSIADTGIGIPAASLPYVFDKFYRVKSAATQDIPGTGLGLAITRSIIEAHGGRIWADSVEGQGTTFSFTLPPAP
jgi:two-component system phosphate regulon sensor histidine kinase PhoR